MIISICFFFVHEKKFFLCKDIEDGVVEMHVKCN